MVSTKQGQKTWALRRNNTHHIEILTNPHKYATSSRLTNLGIEVLHSKTFPDSKLDNTTSDKCDTQPIWILDNYHISQARRSPKSRTVVSTTQAHPPSRTSGDHHQNGMVVFVPSQNLYYSHSRRRPFN